VQQHHIQLTDEELLRRFKADKNSDWIGILFDRYAVLLLGMCMKYLKNEEDARDSVQQLFLKVLSEISKHDIQYFRAWIYQVARNHCLMQLRQKHTRYREEPSDRNIPATAEQEDVVKSLREKDRLLDDMGQALEMLNPEQRSCVELFYLQKLSYQQIAEHTGYSLLQVKSYIQNGKRNLKLILMKQRNLSR
jgi:RNA polymerase sigma factor (sigma-70 family)